MLTLVQRVGAVRTFLAVLSHDNRQIAQLLQHINLAVGEGGFKGKAFPYLGPSSQAVRQMTKFASEMGTAPMGTVSGPRTHITAAISAVTAI